MFKIIILLLCVVYCMAHNLLDSQFGKDNQGIIAAFGDFNSDELTDVFIIKKKSNLIIYLAYDKEPLFRPSNLACNFSNFIITSVVPGDFDGDAYMDILLTTQQINGTSNLHEVRILWGGTQNLNCSDALLVKAMSFGQPLVIDYNHDMTLDVFGLNAQKKRVYWIFNPERITPYEVSMGKELKDLKLPHSHSFVDVNEDNAADLLVTTNIDVEVWLSNATEGFYFSKAIGFPLGYSVIQGQAVFLDMALSGKFNLVMPVCNDLECKESAILIYDKNQWKKLEIDFYDNSGTLWRFVPPRNEYYLDTIMIRTGDYNMDGYPDLLMTLSPVNSNETRAFLLHNVPHKNNRTFAVQWDMFESFGSNVVMATFYDLYSNGVLDIVYVKKNITTGTYEMKTFTNILDHDANFIKVIVVTGLTNAKVPINNRTIYRRKITFGTNLPGPKISYKTWSSEGNIRAGVCAQLPQSAYFSLGLPYSIFGLDRTPNFVQRLDIGLSGHLRSWKQIIPNSQIVVTPAPPDDPSQWRAELFVTPSKIILQSVFAIGVILLILIVLISYLHWKEKKDDAQDRDPIIN